MDKKEAKRLFLLKQLEDPNISEFEKKSIKSRLGIKTTLIKEDLINKQGDELISYVADYMYDLLPTIRREKRTSTPFDLFSDTQRTTYYLCNYGGILEDDSLEQLEDIGDFNEIESLIKGFKIIGLTTEVKLVESMLRNGKITTKKIDKITDHFQENLDVISNIDQKIESFILDNTDEILRLQNL